MYPLKKLSAKKYIFVHKVVNCGLTLNRDMYKIILLCSLGKLEKERALNYLVEKVLLFVQILYYFFTHFWVENYDDVGKNMLNHVSSYVRETCFSIYT